MHEHAPVNKQFRGRV